MERRKALKNLSGLAALAFLPKQHLFALQQKKPLHIVGLGTAGTKVLQLFQSKGMGDHFTAITDSISSTDRVQLLPFSHPLNKRERILRECYNPDDVTPFVFPEEVIDIFNKGHHFLLLAGLGGYTGTHMSRTIIPMLHGSNIDFSAVLSLPFAFEGKKKREITDELVKLTHDLPQVHYVDNEAMRQHWGNLTIREAFSMVDEKMVETYADFSI